MRLATVQLMFDEEDGFLQGMFLEIAESRFHEADDSGIVERRWGLETGLQLWDWAEVTWAKWRG